jgi:hypothetical protein
MRENYGLTDDAMLALLLAIYGLSDCGDCREPMPPGDGDAVSG